MALLGQRLQRHKINLVASGTLQIWLKLQNYRPI